MVDKKIVYKIEPGMNPREVLATTYQMRNFYRQLGDGFFSSLDTMNYIQHHQIAKWCKKGYRVLDVCCGRGLLLPLLRYLSPDIASYTGVDIEPRNAIWQKQRVTDNKPLTPNYYPFATRFVEANVAEMAQQVGEQVFDIIVYTSAIEHMNPDLGLASLVECRKLSKPGTMLVLTCPNTPPDQDGYATQYAAHVYEWKEAELREGLQGAGFRVVTEYGLLIDRKTLSQEAERLGFLPLLERVEKFVPPEWYLPVFATMFPKQSKEIGFVCQAV
jgi:2-polyprenyl-3-methyl-5-hydroxy-6-metoxy-1,4-benzoquinol methylase